MVRFKNRYLLIKVETQDDYFPKPYTKEDILNVRKWPKNRLKLIDCQRNSQGGIWRISARKGHLRLKSKYFDF